MLKLEICRVLVIFLILEFHSQEHKFMFLVLRQEFVDSFLSTLEAFKPYIFLPNSWLLKATRIKAHSMEVISYDLMFQHTTNISVLHSQEMCGIPWCTLALPRGACLNSFGIIVAVQEVDLQNISTMLVQ